MSGLTSLLQICKTFAILHSREGHGPLGYTHFFPCTGEDILRSSMIYDAKALSSIYSICKISKCPLHLLQALHTRCRLLNHSRMLLLLCIAISIQSPLPIEPSIAPSSFTAGLDFQITFHTYGRIPWQEVYQILQGILYQGYGYSMRGLY